MPPSLQFDFDRYPYLTPELGGIGGQIRQQPSDFQVSEVPAYPLSGEGEHLFLHLEKTGLTTRQLLERIRDGLGVKEKDIGVAGLKDKHAQTRQWLSIPAKFEPHLAGLDSIENIKLLETSRHNNKLKIGHIKGNRFRILVRGVNSEQGLGIRDSGLENPDSPLLAQALTAAFSHPFPTSTEQASAILRKLSELGVPNYFGPQRFGLGGQNAIKGYDLVTGKKVHVLPWLKRFLVSSLQSLLYNDWVQLRLERRIFHQVIEGDVAKKHDSGGEFVVEQAELENPRALRFEISAMGALYGKKYREAFGAARAIEDEILARYELERSQFDRRFGDRRAIRLPLNEWSVTESAEGVWVDFFLPKGAYATAVLREVMKKNPEAQSVTEDEESQGEDMAF